MNSNVTFSCFCLFLFFSSSVKAFNLPKILGQYPAYSTFHELLEKTGLYQEMRSRETTTVLVVKNENMKEFATRPLDVIKRVLATHIIFDYYDAPKIVLSSKTKTIAINMYQSSGISNGKQGLTNITATPDNKIGFGSAVPGSPIDVKLEKMVMSIPYNLSILEVSGVIYTPGIDGTLAAPPRKAIVPTPPAEKNGTLKVSPSPSPSASDNDDDYDPKIVPVASTPAGSPQASAPSQSPAEAQTPEADKEAADATPPAKSSGMSLGSGLLSGLMLTLVSSLAAF